MADDLRSLRIKRGQTKAHITRFNTFLRGCNDANQLTELKSRFKKFESIWDDFENIQSKIELLPQDSQDNADPDSDERSLFEDEYFKTLSIANDLIKKFETKSCSTQNENITNQVSNQTSQNQESLVRLPPINLPEFSGSYDKWSQFSECFTSIIDQNSSLNTIQKFFYLRSCIKGEAAQTIQAIPTSEANYSVAWDLLKSRYENKRIIINSHVKSIIEFQPLVKETYHGLRKLLDCIQKNVRSLKALGQPVETWDTLLIFIIVSKFDPTTKREWEMSFKDNSLPTYESLIKYITNKCYVLETMSFNDKSHYQKQKKLENTSTVSYLSTSENKTNKTFQISCSLCKLDHYLYRCPDFLKLSVEQRLRQVEKLRLCKNCLRPFHNLKSCKFGGCKHCSQLHNTVLHIDKHVADASKTITPMNDHDTPRRESSAIIRDTESANNSVLQNGVCLHAAQESDIYDYSPTNYVMLSTAVVNIQNFQGDLISARAVLDSASQSNFMTRDLFQRLGFKGEVTKTPVVGINGVSLNLREKVKITIYSRHSSFKANLEFFILDKITQKIPNIDIDDDSILIPNNIKLADRDFCRPDKIDLLIGAEIFYELLSVGQIKTKPGQPIFQKSKLGWFVCGPMTLPKSNSKTLCHLVINNKDNDLRECIEKFWRIEEFEKVTTFNKEEIKCEQYFCDTTKRGSDGRFIVKLPLKANPSVLGNSLEIAINRFHSIERKLNKNSDLKSQYDEFMREYETLGHMTRIPKDEINSNKNKIYYLPHHAVVKEGSLTSRVRVVFDASSKTDTGLSLNDISMVGPTIQDDIFSILIRFRKYECVLTADIAKMYRQVLVSPEHSDLQRIVYRWNSTDELTHFRLNTVTYGTAPASFLAIRCLHQIAFDVATQHPRESKVISEDFYVDDLLTGCKNLEDTITLKQNLTRILQNYGFHLRKWFSNRREVLESEDEMSELPYYHITNDQCIKTLGLLWDANADKLIYTANINSTPNKTTKRSILSVVAKIFDPLGLLGPVIILAKQIIQKLWQVKLGWDEPIPYELQKQWDEFQQKLPNLNQIRIPRLVIPNDTIELQIHGFSDASEKSYGASVYLRCTNEIGVSCVALLCAKSKVAPLKSISLPKLELCGAVLLARLVDKVKSSLRVNISNIYYWCDSTIVLAWIAKESNTWKTFVANRVGEINRLTEPSQWSHVASADNPADIISRGRLPHVLATSKLWWTGPDWLSLEQHLWPKDTNLNVCTDEERKFTLLTIISHDQSIFTRYSSLFKLQRVVGYCLRFRHNLSHKNSKLTGSLTVDEIDEAMYRLILITQANEFSEEIDALKKSKHLPKASKILTLHPFLDERGLLRVGGRIRNAKIKYDQKFPVLLPKSHPLTKLIIRDIHYNNMHAGMQATLAAVRLKFWPIAGKQTVRNMLRNCVICFKANPSNFIPIMGDLPKSRVIINRPFINTGVDFTGPFLIRDGKIRNRKLVKAYIAIFVCFATRASHLEVVSDLSTESFLNALKRFISRRGICKNLYSDNGTNFVGSNNELKHLYNAIVANENNRESVVSDYLLKNCINWHFIPARSPHFGGVWEAAVKSVKFHLKRVANNVHFTFEEFSTLSAQIEALLNSRPLVPMSDDPSDFSILTPGHFLIGDSMIALPERDVTDLKLGRLSNYQKIQHIFQNLCRRWQREVLSHMQQRVKWHSQRKGVNPFQVGALVLLQESNSPPMHWPLGRIIKVIPGSDGVIRVVDVQTKNVILRRAVHKICVLPSSDMLEDEASKGGGMFVSRRKEHELARPPLQESTL